MGTLARARVHHSTVLFHWFIFTVHLFVVDELMIETPPPPTHQHAANMLR